MKKQKIEWKLLANYLLDYLCRDGNLESVVEVLIDGGFNDDVLLELGFDKETIETAKEIMNRRGTRLWRQK